MPKPTSFRLKAEIRAMLRWLAARRGGQTRAVEMAIQELYEKDKRTERIMAQLRETLPESEA